MPKQLKEIKQFHKGIISSTSTQDIPDESSAFSINLETRNAQAYIRGANEDYLLYPKKNSSDTSVLPFVTKLEMLDLGNSEDLFLYSSELGLNYIQDWYDKQTLGTSWNPKTTSIIPCFAKNNKEMHIGFGSSLSDSFPAWMGYSTHYQFGQRVSPDIMIEPAALEPPDVENVCFGVDKIIRIETDFYNSYDYNESTSTYTRSFRRPYIDSSKIDVSPGGGTYGSTNDEEDASRYSEDIGADCWLYGCQRGGSYIYKFKMENSTDDVMAGNANIDANTQCFQNLKEGDIRRSNKIIDNQGRFIIINSIAPSMRYKNCLWALSAEREDNRIFLLDVNDYYNIHDPQDVLGNGNATWDFTKDVVVLGEWVINFPTISGPDGNVELVPDGEWYFSDILETFECEPTTNENLAADETPLYSDVAPNGKIYEGATGEILTHRIWISLYKEGGFTTKLYNHETVEPFVFSADIMHLNHSTFGGVLNFTNQTIPLRKMSTLSTTNSGYHRPMAISPLFWAWRDSEGPYLLGSTSGWDEIKYIGTDGNPWLDAEDYANSSSAFHNLHFGNNLGFIGNDISVKVAKFALAWTYGKCGAKFWQAVSDPSAPGDAYDDYNWKETKDSFGDIHQVLTLCHSSSPWVYDGGSLRPERISIMQDTWIGQQEYVTKDLGIFLMLCSHKYLGLGYGHFYESRSNEDDYDGLSVPDFFQAYPKEALNWKDSKALFRLDENFQELEFDNIKSFTSLYNNVQNMNSLTYLNGKVFLYISEAYKAPEDTEQVLSKTRLWAIDSRDSNSYNTLYPDAGNKEREAELQKLHPIDPNASGEYIGPKIIDQVGSGVICAMNSHRYPIGGYHVGSNGFLDGIPQQEHANVFFIAPTVGEYKNGVFFGIQDSTQTISSDGYYWDQDISAGGDGTAAGGKYFTSSANDSTQDKFWSGFEWPVTNGTMGTLATPGFSDSLDYGTFLCIFANDDASLSFDNSAITDDNQLHAYPLETFGSPTRIRYKMNYLYDGYQHSPLSQTTWYNQMPAPVGSETGVTEVKVSVSLDSDVIPKRVTHVNLWVSTDEEESFKLAAKMTLARGWSFDDVSRLYSTIITDRGAKQTGESFVAATNIPETLETMKLKYSLSTVANNYHIVGNCWHPKESGLEFYLFRSEHKRFDMFNWSTMWVKLPNIPTALATFNGKVYAFDKHNMYRIDPNTFYLEDTFEGIGCAGSEAICVTEFGMCWADTNNVYLNDGTGPKKITQKILTSKEPGFGIDEISLNANTRIIFDQEKGNFSIFVSSGKEGLYTEGLEYVYQYSSYPYHGYYNIDERNIIWTGAYKSNTSISLRKMTQDEIEEWSDTSS